MSARDGDCGAVDGEIHRADGFCAVVFSTDHKVIGRQFLFLGLAFLAVGGFMAMLIRWQLARPGAAGAARRAAAVRRSGGVISPAAYTSLFTMHGTIMIFFAVTPILIGGFGNFCLPLMIGARDMAFPRLNMLSFWTMAAATAMLTASFFVPLGAAAGGLDGLRDAVDGDRRARARPDAVGGRDLPERRVVGHGRRQLHHHGRSGCARPGMTWFRLPLTVWGFFLTSILNALFVPVLAAAMVLLFFDRVFGTQFFIAGSDDRGRAAIRSSTSTCSGCSATPRSTS